MMILVLILVLCIFLFFVGGERGAIVVTTLAGNVCVLAVTVILLANGMPIFPIVFLAAVLISYITLIRQNGNNQKTWSAFVSVAGIMLVLSVAIAVIVHITNAGGLNEIQSVQEDVAFYYTLDIQIPMQKIAVGVVILSALGAIMDTALSVTSAVYETSVYKGYKQDKIEMRGDRAEMSDFPLYLNTVAGGLDRRDQTIGGFSFVVKIYALPVVEIIGQLLYLLGRYGFNTQFGDCL